MGKTVVRPCAYMLCALDFACTPSRICSQYMELRACLQRQHVLVDSDTTINNYLYPIGQECFFTLLQMTKLVLPKMMEKKRGVIVNVSSGLAMQRLSVPMAVVYSASKVMYLQLHYVDVKRTGHMQQMFVSYSVLPLLSPIVFTRSMLAKASLSRFGSNYVTAYLSISSLMHLHIIIIYVHVSFLQPAVCYSVVRSHSNDCSWGKTLIFYS